MSYMSAHNRTRRVRGKAHEHVCPCGVQAHEWAYQGSKEERVDSRGLLYSENPMDYMAMCRGCHRRLDKSHITHCPHGHEYASGNVIIDSGKRKCRECVYAPNRKRPMTAEQKLRKIELQRIRRERARQDVAA